MNSHWEPHLNLDHRDVHTKKMTTTSDPVAAHSRATLVTAVTITFLTTAWLAVLARTWVRAVMIRNYGWDDAMILLAVVRTLVVVKDWNCPC